MAFLTIPNPIRHTLCVLGMCLFTISSIAIIGIAEIPFVGNYVVLVLSIVIFLIGFYSPKHGFDGFKSDQGTIEDSAPGMGQRKKGIFGDGPFDGGDGSGGSD